MEFRTASAFKSRGKYQVLPTSRLILQNLIQKWNGSFPDCPIEDEDGQGMEAMADGLLYRRFQLYDRTYFLKGNAVPGFVGTVTLENCLSGFHRELADALLTFAGYAGVGIKTSLGMGGVIHRTESSQKNTARVIEKSLVRCFFPALILASALMAAAVPARGVGCIRISEQVNEVLTECCRPP